MFLRRCSAALLVLLLCCAYSAPARADVVGGLKYNTVSLWDFLTTGTTDWNLRDSLGAYTGGTWAEKYADFLDKLITGLGTDEVVQDGYVLHFPALSYSFPISDPELFQFTPGTPTVFSFICWGGSPRLQYAPVTAPVSGTYSFYYRISGDRQLEHCLSVSTHSAGYVFDEFELSIAQSNFLVRLLVDYYVIIKPYEYVDRGNFRGGGAGRDGKPLDATGSDDIAFGEEQGDGTVAPVQITNLFNETTNVFYNPVTNNYETAENWFYDYSERSYTFEVDGSIAVVAYGDEYASVTIDNATYKYYYLLSEDVTPPSPGPSPTPPPSGGDHDYTGLFGTVVQWLKDIWSAITGLGSSIVGGIRELLVSLFSPSEDGVNNLNSQVDEKLPVIGDLQSLGDELVSTLENPGGSANDLRMTTVVDLGKGRGSILGSAQINILDVTWYLEYKPLVDDIIVGFAWLVFLWNLYGQLPSIIHGGASALHTTSAIQREADYYSWRHKDDS